MKKSLISLAVILGMSTAIVPAVSGNDQTPIYIVVSQQDQGGNSPRSPRDAPSKGYILGGTIILQFSEDIGEVDMCLDEASSCNVMSNVVLDTSVGYAVIPFSGAEGSYTLTFTLEDGTVYTGRFEVL